MIYITISAFFLLMSLLLGKLSSMDGIGNKQFAITTTHQISFDEVIGLNSVKKELLEYVNFMRYRDTYLSSGFTIPKGLLFIGPPGTGKTYLYSCWWIRFY
jgi:cell division protease FtsH